MSLSSIRARLIALAIGTVCASGCESTLQAGARSSRGDDQPVQVVIGRINDNSAAMNFLLRGRSVKARGRWDGESFDLVGTLLYRKPRNLYLKLEHTLSKGIEVGSNDRQFWVWKRIKDDRYWWGEYANIETVEGGAMPVRPDHILEVLGLQFMPGEEDASQRPLFNVSDGFYELSYTSKDVEGARYLSRKVRVDREPPYLIREILFYAPDGHPIVSATLSQYGTVRGSTVLAPHRIAMKWLEQDSWLDLEIGRMENAGTGIAGMEKRFIPPLQQGRDVGVVERVDHPRLRRPDGESAGTSGE